MTRTKSFTGKGLLGAGKLAGILLAVMVAAGTSPCAAQTKVDAKLASYKATTGVSGTLKSVGSDTMNNLMTLWAEGFNKFYPNVKVEVEGKGSSTAPPALIGGTAAFGPMSRPMKADEIDQFEKKFGYKPTLLPTGIDMLAVYVHKDNPIKSLSLADVDAIFSVSRKLGAKSEITKWGQLGLTGDWAEAPIGLYGRNSASGTYTYFKEHALGKGDFRDTVKEQPGSASVVTAIAADKYSIGYSGIGFKTADVNAVPLSAKPDGKPIAADLENAYSGDYPLARQLLVYINYKPGSKLDPLRREFIKYIFSREGQEVVIKDGYFPIPAPMAAKTLTSLGIK
ncbi:MAG: PstS family phosphate ABC transporter substrate-binding protein [Planctomycetota bacterium]